VRGNAGGRVEARRASGPDCWGGGAQICPHERFVLGFRTIRFSFEARHRRFIFDETVAGTVALVGSDHIALGERRDEGVEADVVVRCRTDVRWTAFVKGARRDYQADFISRAPSDWPRRWQGGRFSSSRSRRRATEGVHSNAQGFCPEEGRRWYLRVPGSSVEGIEPGMAHLAPGWTSVKRSRPQRGTSSRADRSSAPEPRSEGKWTVRDILITFLGPARQL